VLVEIAIGDAYGAGFEFSERPKIEQFNSGKNYIQHDLGIPPGKYTDDTQMSIAIAEILLSPASFTRQRCADSFIDTFKRDQRQGYAKKFQLLLSTCQTGTELINRIEPQSTRNGAAMRSVPLGLIQDKQKLLAAAKGQASVTHDTHEGILSSQVIALAAHYLIYDEARINDLSAMIFKETGFSIDTNWNGAVDCDAIQTIHAVFTSLLRNLRFSTLLIDCVNHGGDVDSVAAIASGLASVSAEYQRDIPENLLNTLENEAYGLSFLKQLDRDLQRTFPDLPVFY
jgi:ADP-ribosyl-[dinitrogen reductase] hydrolase